MKLIDALKKVDFDEIEYQLGRFCPSLGVHGFKVAFDELCGLQPRDFPGFKIEVTNELDEELRPYVHVCGIDDSDEHVAISLTPWEMWLGAELTKKTLELTWPEIVAHCLYEMTFWGYDQETIRAEVAELDRRAREAEEHPELLIDHEDVMKMLEEEIKKQK